MKGAKVALLAIFLAGICDSANAADTQQPVLVYAAASLTNALDEVGNAYTNATGQSVKFSYASSSILARQIEAGADADVFFSADSEWMDYVQSRNLVRVATRTNLLTNKLVLIAPADSTAKLEIKPGFDLAGALGDGRLATGDPESVPVGKYARSALMSLGVWNQVADRIVRADNVRAALAFVDRGEVPLGIVYETDARVDKNVRVVATFPEDTHPPIVYPLAVTTVAKAGSEAFVEFARGPKAHAVFEKFGFGLAD
jgi:molybdate transport system substrate-binding protein